jgi:hypothetical protein
MNTAKMTRKPLWPDFSRPQEKPTSAKSQETDKKWWYTNDLPMFIVTFFGVIAVIVYTCVTRQQLNVMQRTLDDAEIQEAASVTIRNLTITGFPDNTIVSFDVVNSGRTRADQVIMPVMSNWFQPNDEFEILKNVPSPNNPNEFGFSIEPSDPPRHMSFQLGSFPFWPKGIPIPAEVLKRSPTKDDFISGRREITFTIAGIYLDVFGKVHHVADCVISRGGAGHFEPCMGQQNRHY